MCRKEGRRCPVTERTRQLHTLRTRVRRREERLADTTLSAYKRQKWETVMDADREALQLLLNTVVNHSTDTPTLEELGLIPALTPDQVEEQREYLKELGREGSTDALLIYADQRVQHSYFRNLLARKEEFKADVERLEAEYRENGDCETGLQALEAFERLQVAEKLLDEYRALTAEALSIAHKHRAYRERVDGTARVYSGDGLDGLEVLPSHGGDVKSWMEARRDSIGGGDVGFILKVDPKYGAKNYRDVMAAKVNPVTDEMVAEQEANYPTFFDAAGRGMAWEPQIVQMFAQAHPELNVLPSPHSFASKSISYRHANFDAVTVDENGKIDGIVEIKTSSDSSKWGPESEGLQGVPAVYRKQALWYASLAGVNKATVVVVINDHDYREYSSSLDTPEVQAEIVEMLEKTDKFWDDVQRKRAAGPVVARTRTNKGFTATEIGRGNHDKVAESIAVYTERDKAEVLADIKARVDELPNPTDVSAVSEVYRDLYREFDPSTRSRSLVGIDIETSGMIPTRGRIIETGITVLTPQGDLSNAFSALHGVPEASEKGLGTGMQEVHNIALEDISDKPHFGDEENQRTILNYLKSGIMVAHNAQFEDRFLRLNLKGYAQARDAGEIQVLDTMQLSKHLMLDTADNTMESFATGNAVEYVDAHRAVQDTSMMMRALKNFQQSLYSREEN